MRNVEDGKRAKILDRIKKLLALSTSSNVNEAATAAAAVQKLMMEHRLTEADVSDTQAGQMFELSMGAVGFDSRWKFVLVTTVARTFFCEAVGLRVGRRRKVRIVDLREDAVIAARVFRYLHSEIDRLAKIEIESIDWDGGDLRSGGARSGGSSMILNSTWNRSGAGPSQLSSPSFPLERRSLWLRTPGHLAIASRDRDQVRAYVGSRFADTRRPGQDDVAGGDDLAFVRGYEQAQAIVVPGHGRVSEDVRDPEKSGGRKAGRASAGEPESGSATEVFVRSEAGPAVDVVVTHVGSVPLVPASQPDSPAGDADPANSEGTGQEEVRNVESFFTHLKKWWETKD